MASNNYALIISDPTKARWVLTDLNRMASRGGAFKVLKFNPASDRFPISCGRESNLPPLLYVEEDGATVDGAIGSGAVAIRSRQSTLATDFSAFSTSLPGWATWPSQSLWAVI
jgi:hypothetical protein